MVGGSQSRSCQCEARLRKTTTSSRPVVACELICATFTLPDKIEVRTLKRQKNEWYSSFWEGLVPRQCDDVPARCCRKVSAPRRRRPDSASSEVDGSRFFEVMYRLCLVLWCCWVTRTQEHPQIVPPSRYVNVINLVARVTRRRELLGSDLATLFTRDHTNTCGGYVQ
uniref:Uncharacterized protein n=1 Tax=Timema monikensis TaxID=170555 RepID=A0A7R9E7D2_9NEOP|nr:unnamed protein product [Timema monikensis]